MPATVRVRQKGGDRLRRTLQKLGTGGVRGVRVGFFSTARYPNGTPVAAVAAWNEFGTTNADGDEHVPERPFFRQTLAEQEDAINNLLVNGVDPASGEGGVSPTLAGRLGAYVASKIQEKIVELDEPPNAPSTIARKKSSNPLVDVGTMHGSVTWVVDQ